MQRMVAVFAGTELEMTKSARKSGEMHDSFVRMEPALPRLIREAMDIVG